MAWCGPGAGNGDFEARADAAAALLIAFGVVQGMEILKRALTQLLLYYTRFLDVVKRHCREHATLSRDMVNIPSLIAEIKKYSRTFA